MTDEEKAERNRRRIYGMSFGSVYPLYVQKAEKKGRTKAEVDEVIAWLTGYEGESLERAIADGRDYESFFREAPAFTPLAKKITGTICGYRVEEIEDEVIWKLRCLDKLVDELARGKAMEKIKRS